MEQKLKLERGMSSANFINNELMHGERNSSRTHKYIRKYQSKSGKWVYIYKKDDVAKSHWKKIEHDGSMKGPKYQTDGQVDSTVVKWFDDYIKDGFTGDGKQYRKTDIDTITMRRSKDGKSYYFSVNTKDGHKYDFPSYNKKKVDALAHEYQMVTSRDESYKETYGDGTYNVGGGGRTSSRR